MFCKEDSFERFNEAALNVDVYIHQMIHSLHTKNNF